MLRKHVFCQCLLGRHASPLQMAEPHLLTTNDTRAHRMNITTRECSASSELCAQRYLHVYRTPSRSLEKMRIRNTGTAAIREHSKPLRCTSRFFCTSFAAALVESSFLLTGVEIYNNTVLYLDYFLQTFTISPGICFFSF